MSDNQSTNDMDELSKNVIVTSSYVVANREIEKEMGRHAGLWAEILRGNRSWPN